ncbi:hypothetical protein [Pedobacter sp. SL55]|uniref:hypothetical protein n=1 Tax=Pedobacter sp. SL55 TaxID=2995161 RepID=UPI00226E366F|nr:hypothetical protein [Pedobacter sp. SL55]WAC42308.1 hypothetical protein OVA16_08120 [Pedobacter sp. SL55]
MAFVCLLAILTGCVTKKEATPKIKQGVFGTLNWIEGNMMPSPDEPKTTRHKVVARELQIYEVVTFKDVEGEAPLFTKVKGRLVKTVKSTTSGFYECELPVGEYSVFTVEPDGKLFANNFDGGGKINAISVMPENQIKLDIQINYKAAY